MLHDPDLVGVGLYGNCPFFQVCGSRGWWTHTTSVTSLLRTRQDYTFWKMSQRKTYWKRGRTRWYSAPQYHPFLRVPTSIVLRRAYNTLHEGRNCEEKNVFEIGKPGNARDSQQTEPFSLSHTAALRKFLILTFYKLGPPTELQFYLLQDVYAIESPSLLPEFWITNLFCLTALNYWPL